MATDPYKADPYDIIIAPARGIRFYTAEGTEIYIDDLPYLALIKAAADGSGGGTVPSTVHVVTIQAENSLSNEFNLGSLASGILKQSVSAGVSTPAIATGGTDYANPPDGVTLEDSGSSTTRIKDGGVALSKIATIAATTLLGNSTGLTATPAALTASQARTLLSLVVGTNVEAWSAVLDALAAVMSSTATAAAQRTALGLGTASTHPDTDFLQAANNLSELADKALSRTNLGVAIGTNVEAWSAVLDALTTVMSSTATAAAQRTALGLGTAATHATGDFLQTTNNLSDVTAATARTNLGLGTAATQNTSAFLQPSNNLSDVSSASTARGNLGVYGENSIGNSGSSKTVDWSLGHSQDITLTAACTLTFSNPVAGEVYVLRVAQDGTGSRTITWPASVHWAAGTSPTLTTTASKIDIFTFSYDGIATVYYGVTSGQNYS